jgi:hypothetical protein
MSSTKSLFERALEAEGITGPLADIARSIYKQESGSGTNTKTSNAGAVGGMQILPGTFKEVADRDWNINDPLHNARAGIRYVQKMHKRAGGDPVLTAAGYYGGPGGLDKARRGIAVSDPRNPRAPTTLQYGQQVAARLPGARPVAATPPVGAAFGRYPAPKPAPGPMLQVSSDELAAPLGLPAQPAPVAAPVSVVAQGTSGEAPVAAPAQDPWQAFLAQSREPVRPSDLAYGRTAPVGPAPGFEVDVPDFMGMLANRQIAPDFSAFAGLGRRVRG